jgi:hypothetical protein
MRWRAALADSHQILPRVQPTSSFVP